MSQKTIEDEIREYEERTGQTLPAHNKATLRSMIEREHKFWEREGADFIRGFDDGEPQTTVDFNHYNGSDN